MQRSILLLPFILLAPEAHGQSQESLCNPCVDVPSRLYQPYRLTGPDNQPVDGAQQDTTVVTPALLQGLRLSSLDEMRRQFPGSFGAFECPVTLSAAGPSFSFDGETGGSGNPVWFGTRSFSVNLRDDGSYARGDRFFWYAEGFRPEQASLLQVEIRRLDPGPLTASAADPTTTIFDERWHMQTGIEFGAAGCWEISGTYMDRTLSFVVESLGP